MGAVTHRLALHAAAPLQTWIGARTHRLTARAATAAPRAAALKPSPPLVSNPTELTRAVAAVRPGDTITMADGNWKDVDLLFEGEGAAEKPITLRAQTPGKVILSGTSRLRIAGRYLVVDGLCFRDGAARDHVVAFRASPAKLARHCRLTNSAIIDYNPPEKQPGSKWVSLYGTHNRVDHCFFKGKTDVGTTLVVWLSDQPNYHRIDHNHFGPRPPLGENGGETIRVGTSDWSMSDSRTVVEHNYFEECDGEAEIISSKSCENIYRYNTFVRCSGALTLRHGNRCTIEGNFFLGEGKRGTGGVRVIGEDHRVFNNYMDGLAGDGARSAISLRNGIPNSPLAGYFQVKRALIAFNTIVGCKSSLVVGLGAGSGNASLPPTECTIANNLIARGEAPLIRQEDRPIRLTWQSNLAHGAETGLPPDAGIRVADPGLVQGRDRLWRPTPNGPASAAAQGEFPFVQDDIDGQPRPPKKDIGCDQSSTAPVGRRPLTPRDVGPAWRREA
jgi:poly(beta-D-mannuronate) lyase